jgi:hypothetical protein
MLLRCESELELLVVFRKMGDMLVQDPPFAQYDAIFQLPLMGSCSI